MHRAGKQARSCPLNEPKMFVAFCKLEIFEETAGGFDEEQGLGSRAASECAKVLE